MARLVFVCVEIILVAVWGSFRSEVVSVDVELELIVHARGIVVEAVG